MTQRTDFQTRRAEQSAAAPDLKLCCTRCGADVWTILQCGQVCCSDCEQNCPCCVNFTPEALQ